MLYFVIESLDANRIGLIIFPADGLIPDNPARPLISRNSTGGIVREYGNEYVVRGIA